MLLSENFDAAEQLYRNAMSLAQHQGAKLWELRAATSLAQLYRGRNHHTKACDLLAPIYQWFTEGFDTPDLIKAKTILDEIAAD